MWRSSITQFLTIKRPAKCFYSIWIKYFYPYLIVLLKFSTTCDFDLVAAPKASTSSKSKTVANSASLNNQPNRSSSG